MSLDDFPTQIVTRGRLDFVLLNTGFAIVNTRDGAHPEVVGTFSSSAPDRIAVSGNKVFVGGFDALRVVDVSKPATPVEIASVPFATDVFDLAVSQGVLAVAGEDDTLRLYDVSNPKNPMLVHRRPVSAFGLATRNNLLLVGATGGLQILDVADPAGPVDIGGIGPPLTVFSIALEGSQALLSGRVGTFGDLAALRGVLDESTAQEEGLFDDLDEL
ncbi:MAG: LVIVD repeat-containing protein, partial [Acidobacteriota bacterium]